MDRKQPTVTRTWVNGREFRTVRWPADREIDRPVIVTWAVWKVKSPSVFTGAFMGRREV